MKALDILVVEDEILIGESIKYLLQEKNHKVLDIVISYDEAIEALNIYLPDLVLLDIRLYGEKSGVDLANYINENSLEVPYVFLTSQYDSDILAKALSTSPYGYLTKPIQNESLLTTVQSAHQLFTNRFNKKSLPLILSDGNQENRIDQNDILFIKADHVYAQLFLKDNHQLMVRQTLSSLLDKLDANIFIQIHRSYIVNLSHVKSWNNRKAILSGHEIPISRSKKSEFFERIIVLFDEDSD